MFKCNKIKFNLNIINEAKNFTHYISWANKK